MSDPFGQRQLWIAEREHLTGEFQLRSGDLRSERLDRYRLASDPRLNDQADPAMAAGESDHVWTLTENAGLLA